MNSPEGAALRYRAQRAGHPSRSRMYVYMQAAAVPGSAAGFCIASIQCAKRGLAASLHLHRRRIAAAAGPLRRAGAADDPAYAAQALVAWQRGRACMGPWHLQRRWTTAEAKAPPPAPA
jgi:hypothetical protein